MDMSLDTVPYGARYAIGLDGGRGGGSGAHAAGAYATRGRVPQDIGVLLENTARHADARNARRRHRGARGGGRNQPGKSAAHAAGSALNQPISSAADAATVPEDVARAGNM